MDQVIAQTTTALNPGFFFQFQNATFVKNKSSLHNIKFLNNLFMDVLILRY